MQSDQEREPKVYDTFVSKPHSSMETEKGFTIQEAIDHIGFGWKQIQIGVVSGFCLLLDGLEIYMLSIIGPELMCRWQLSKKEEALITTVVFAGMLIGSPILGYIADIYGRKKVLTFSAFWVFYYGFLSAWSPTYTWILILRCLVGFGVCGIAFCTPYYVEFLPTNKRGKVSSAAWGMVSLGASLGTVLAMLFIQYSWRLWVAILSFPAFLYVLLSYFLPTSPRYELACGRKEAARKILEDLAHSNGKELPPGELLSGPAPERAKFSVLFRPDLRLTTALLAFEWFFINFVYYGYVLFTTEFINAGTSCHPISAVDGQFICKAGCKTLGIDDYIVLLLTTIGDFAGIFISALFVDILGRKKLMMLMFLIIGTSCFLLGICMDRVPMIMILIGGRMMAEGLFITLYLYTSEIYPTEVRALAVGCGACIGRIGGIFTPFCAQVLLGWSAHVGLSVYGVMCIFGLMTMLLLPIETKGRHID